MDENEVQEGLSHLHDLPYLEAHPLPGLGSAHGKGIAGLLLRQLLLDAIQQLKPIDAGPEAPESAAWRRYRYLVLRYEEGLPHHEVAEKLSVSERQASRDKQVAIRALTDLLQARHVRPSERSEVFPLVPARAAPTVETDRVPLLQAELLQLTQAPIERSTDLGETLRGVIDTIASLAEERRVTIEVALTDHLPPVAMHRTVLRQAFFNLLNYAIEREPGTRILLSAADTTRGIEVSLDLRRSRGRPATTLPAARRRPEVESLLAAGRALLETQGGSIDLRDHAESGLTLEVVLPPTPTPTVLVIDDNPDVVGLFRRYLRRDGYRLLSAGSGRHALKVAAELRPDAITLDLMLPTQDGWEILQQLRAVEATRRTPIIVCSVLPETSLARSLGVTEFLAKPVTREALRSALERCLTAPAS